MVDREQAIRLLNTALSREYNSISEYVLHSSPWTTDADGPALEAFQAIRDIQAGTASWLTTRLREDWGAGPTLRAFEHWRRDLNYLSVPYLVRFAHDRYVEAAGEYAALAAEAEEGQPALKAVFSRLADEARAHGKRLEPFLPEWTVHPPTEGPPAEESPAA